MLDRIIHDVLVVPGAADSEPFVGAVGIARGVIEFVRGGAGVPAEEAADRTNADGHVLLPGLVNAHLHPTPSLVRTGFARLRIDDHEASPLVQRWYAALLADPEALALGARLALAETVMAGTTHVGIYEYLDVGTAACEARQLGVGAAVGMFPAPRDPSWPHTLERVRECGARPMLCGPNEDDPASTEDFLAHLVDLAVELDARVHMHVSETARRHDDFRARTGRTPISHYREIGLLEHLYAVHCTAIDPADLALLAEYDVPVVVTPSSEAMLGDGVADVPALRSAGVTVALGTDGGAWSASEDMFAEMRAAALLNCAGGGPGTLGGAELIEMATLGGARALGEHRRRGSIDVGKRADLVLVDVSRAGLRPLLSGALSNLRDVLACAATGADVAETLVEGTSVYRRARGSLLSDSELAQARDAGERVWRAAGGHTGTEW